MKKLVTSYTFNAAAKTVISADFTDHEGILLITNVTDNIIIYNFADATCGGTLSGTTLTLTYNTTTMSNTDALQIFYDDGKTALDSELTESLQELIQRLAPLASAIANVGGIALRTQGIGTFAVSGPLTSAQLIATQAVAGVNYPNKTAQENLTAHIANINNVTGA